MTETMNLDLEALERDVRTMLPAHETLWARSAEIEGDPAIEWIHVQGRGDRLHGFVRVSLATDSTALRAVPVNWLWLVAETVPGPDTFALASDVRAGIIARDADGRWAQVAKAPPRPGIFVRSWPKLRTEWLKKASW